MLIVGLVELRKLDVGSGSSNGRYLRSCLLIEQSNGGFCISIKNSMYPNLITYNLAYLKEMHSRFVAQGKLALSFHQPKHMVLIKDVEDIRNFEIFFRQIKAISTGQSIIIKKRTMPKVVPPKKNVLIRFDPGCREFQAIINGFDNRILNMRQLNQLVLENCTLSSLPADIGNLPIEYLSLSRSTLATTQFEQEIFWNWMSMKNISSTLKTLKMDEVDLKVLPFEILFLKNLRSLSVANNNLTILPQCVGELSKLVSLNVSGNQLNYLPISLFKRIFETLNISSNKFTDHESQYPNIPHIIKHCDHCETEERKVKMLSLLTFCTMFKHKVQFKRQDLPRSFWKYFDLAGRCETCDQIILPDDAIIICVWQAPAAIDFIRHQSSKLIKWQTMTCRHRCNIIKLG